MSKISLYLLWTNAPVAVVIYFYNLPGRINENVSETATANPVNNNDLIAIPRLFFAANDFGAAISFANEIKILVMEKSAPTIVEKAALMIIMLKIEG